VEKNAASFLLKMAINRNENATPLTLHSALTKLHYTSFKDQYGVKLATPGTANEPIPTEPSGPS